MTAPRPNTEQLIEAFVDAAAHLVAAASAYEKHASRARHLKPRAAADALFATRLNDFKQAAARAQAACQREWYLCGDELDNLRAQLAEARGDSERLDWMIEQCAYVVSDPDCCDGYWLNYARPDGTVWTQATEHETPRAAIDAAKGER